MNKFVLTLNDGSIHEGYSLGRFKRNCNTKCSIKKIHTDCIECKDMGVDMVDLSNGITVKEFEASTVKSIVNVAFAVLILLTLTSNALAWETISDRSARHQAEGYQADQDRGQYQVNVNRDSSIND